MPEKPARPAEPDHLAEPLVLGEVDASLTTSALGMEALMDLMAHAPDGHRVRTKALHALMLTVSDQLGQAQAAMHLVRPDGLDPDPAV